MLLILICQRHDERLCYKTTLIYNAKLNNLQELVTKIIVQLSKQKSLCGAKARPMKPEWALNIKRQCEEQNVAFFFKQWGAWGMDGVKRSKKTNGRMLAGQEWNAFPEQVGV